MKPFTLCEILEYTGALSEAHSGVFTGLRSITEAVKEEVTFFVFDAKRSFELLERTKAGACFVREEFKEYLPCTTVALLADDPYKSFLRLARALYQPPQFMPLRHDSALIHPGAYVDPSCYIGAHVVIQEGCMIGPHSIIQESSIVGAGVHIGSHTHVYPHVNIENARLGSHVVIHSGVRIGSVGFGFTREASGFEDIPHLGRVVIHDQVHIGANSTIDRGTFQDTIIGQGTRIDNLVQIGHNVTLGQYVIIASQCGIAGSCIIGDGCMLGGQVGLADHVVLAPGTQVAAKSGVARSSLSGEAIAGIPAVPIALWRRQVARARRM